jgi:hypothetical protein
MEVSGQLHALAVLPLVPIGWETEWCQNRLEPCEEKKNLLPHAGNRTPAIEAVARR